MISDISVGNGGRSSRDGPLPVKGLPDCGLDSLALWILRVHKELQGAREASTEGRGQWPGVQACFSQPHCAPWASHLPFLGLSFLFQPSKPSVQMAPKAPACSLSLSGGCRGVGCSCTPALDPCPGTAQPLRTSRQAASPSRKVHAARRLGKVPAGRKTRCPKLQPDPSSQASLYISQRA